MNKSDFESPTSQPENQETANASSTYRAASSTNCLATTDQTSPAGNTENDSSPNIQTSGSSNSQGVMKVFAPVITHDVTLPNTARKVPMVMVPVPDSRTLMAIPISTLSQLKEPQVETMRDEQQARELLVWNEGVGTLEGCDLRFKINQLGCLELLDSDDEFENQSTSTKSNAISSNRNESNNNNDKRPVSNKMTNGTSNNTQTTHDSSHKRVKLETEPAPIRQISPGSSLLRDGPNMRRPKQSSGSNLNSASRNQANSLSLLKKVELNQNSVLLEKLLPKQRVEEIKTNVRQWTFEDVKNFVNSIPGCSGYGELFESDLVDGSTLLRLDQRDILEVINVKLGPAVKIYHAISLLK